MGGSSLVAWGALAAPRGAGVEIVLEVDDVEAAAATVLTSGYPLAEPLQNRPWGLRDFRLFDPDGYYRRVTSRLPVADAASDDGPAG